MCARSIGSLFLLVATLIGAWPGAAAAPPARPQDFGSNSWAQLKKFLPRPSIVVFTTTDCAYCPDVIEAVSADLREGARRSGRKATLAIVVMDGAHQPPSWLAEPQYAKADRLYVFRGQELALRHGIDPRWRGMTPYLALLAGGAGSEPRFVIGRPAPEQMAALWAP